MSDRVRVSKYGNKYAVLVDGIRYGALYKSKIIADGMAIKAKADHYIK